MKRFLASGILLALMVTPLARASSSGDELLAALQSRINNGGDLSEVYDAVDDLSNAEVNKLYKKVERAWPRIKASYSTHFRRAASA